jgi:hypothetical protein
MVRYCACCSDGSGIPCDLSTCSPSVPGLGLQALRLSVVYNIGHEGTRPRRDWNSIQSSSRAEANSYVLLNYQTKLCSPRLCITTSEDSSHPIPNLFTPVREGTFAQWKIPLVEAHGILSALPKILLKIARSHVSRRYTCGCPDGASNPKWVHLRGCIQRYSTVATCGSVEPSYKPLHCIPSSWHGFGW